MSSRREEPPRPDWPKIGAISGVVAVLVTIIIAIVTSLVPSQPESLITPTAAPSTPNGMIRGTIVSPIDEQEVRGTGLPVEGTVEGLSSSSYLLCIIKTEESYYYPHEAQVANGEWTSDVGIGPVNIGRRFTFTLILATATQSAFDELRRLREANPERYYDDGVANLPVGIKPLEEIVIYRTS